MRAPCPTILGTALLLLTAASPAAAGEALHPHAARGAAPQADAPRAGPLRHPLLRSGPMLVDTATTSARLWLQTTHPTAVQVRYAPLDRPEQARLSEVVETRPASDLIACVTLAGLPPGTAIAYEIFLGGERVGTPWPLRFETRPLWQWRGPSAGQPHAPPDLALLVGSCAYVNDAPFDRPGEPYGGGFDIFETMADEGADLMLWLGDNVYLRADDWSSEPGMRRRYALSRELPEVQRLLSGTTHAAIWDDHDFGPNDSDRSFGLASAALAVFRDYWPAPAAGLPDAPGCFQRLSLADVDLFLLDDRSFRAPNDAPDGPDKVMFGERQMTWLRDGLRNSGATFKLVLNGNQMLNPFARYEGWARFPHERDAFLAFLAEQPVQGLVLVSGDRHHSELLRLSLPGQGELHELTASPLTAGATGRDLDGEHAARVPGTLVTQRNYGRIDVTGAWGARTLTLSIKDPTGRELWRHALPPR